MFEVPIWFSDMTQLTIFGVFPAKDMVEWFFKQFSSGFDFQPVKLAPWPFWPFYFVLIPQDTRLSVQHCPRPFLRVARSASNLTLSNSKWWRRHCVASRVWIMGCLRSNAYFSSVSISRANCVVSNRHFRQIVFSSWRGLRGRSRWVASG